MIKKTSFLFVFSFAVYFCQAQIINTHPYEFTVGGSAGTTFSSVTFNPKVTQKMLQGITLGLTGRMTMGKNVGLQTEINFSQQGWSEYYEETPDYKYQRRLNYIQLPFYTHVQFGGAKVKGFINGGPQLAYFTGESTAQSTDMEMPPNKTSYQHDMPLEKKLEWGISGGAGIEIRSKIGYFLIEGRFFYSFGDIYSTKRVDNFVKASSQVITVKLSYLIPLYL
jgi:hypothetical protein